MPILEQAAGGIVLYVNADKIYISPLDSKRQASKN